HLNSNINTRSEIGRITIPERSRSNQEHPSMNGNTDPYFIVYEEDEIQDEEDSQNLSILGKIITNKPIHRGSMQSVFSNIWCNPKGLMVKIEKDTFQFTMEHTEDHKH
ncbi:hypothetical protein RYX36_025977, partial [Vicia faba]